MINFGEMILFRVVYLVMGIKVTLLLHLLILRSMKSNVFLKKIV